MVGAEFGNNIDKHYLDLKINDKVHTNLLIGKIKTREELVLVQISVNNKLTKYHLDLKINLQKFIKILERPRLITIITRSNISLIGRTRTCICNYCGCTVI